MRPTKVDQDLARVQASFENDPARAGVIACARRFKSSWIELAEALVEVRRESSWKGWGYPSFDDYTRLELRLKRETVEKLTGSYAFLQRRAPRVLERDGLSDPIPSYQAVDFLRRAEEQDGAPDDALDGIRQRVLDEGAPLTSVAKQYGAQVFPIDEGEKKKKDAAGLRNVAGRLKELLAETRVVPKRLTHEITPLLDQILELASQAGERAA